MNDGIYFDVNEETELGSARVPQAERTLTTGPVPVEALTGRYYGAAYRL